MTEPADVLIIGAGASGGVAALRLARAGLRVVCLEQGDWHDPRRVPRCRGRTGSSSPRKPWSSSPNVRGLPADYPIDLDDSDMVLGNFNGVGGGTVLYSAVWPRLLPSDFRTHSDLGIGDDWPLTLRRAAPVLRGDRPAVRRVRARRQPRLPARRRPPAPAVAHRSGRARARARSRAARMALVAGVQRDPVRRPRRPARVRAARLVRLRVQRGRQGLHRRHALAGRSCRRCAVGDRQPVFVGSRSTREDARAVRPGSTPTVASTSRAPTSCCARPTASAPRACCCSPRTPARRTDWRTRRDWSAAASWCIPVPWSTATSTTTSTATGATSAARSSRCSSAAPIPTVASSAARSGASLPPAGLSRSRSGCAAARPSVPCTTSTCANDSAGRAVGRAVRGPARRRQPHRALVDPGRRLRAPRPEGHLPRQRRRPSRHRVEHRAGHRVARPRPVRSPSTP